MKKRFQAIVAFTLLALFISGCTPSAATTTGSQTTAITSAETTSAVVTTATTAPVMTTTIPPTPSPVPDPGSVALQVAAAYPDLSFEQPLYFAASGEAGSDVCVVERTGRIMIFADTADTASAQVFLDLSSLVNHSGQEQGLLGLAFHPDYISNGYFYVNYTNETSTVIARYSRQTDNSKSADPASARVLLTFKQPYANHNGGNLAFGPDGYLYIATGDGGSAGDPQNNAQNLANLLGKILRIDVDQPSGSSAYGIPADNPFAGNSQGYREEIYAYGLRNPWRFSFDSQGNLWAADVGQNKIEEIDLVIKGGNYGWSAMEGTQAYNAITGIDASNLKPPIWEYDHSLGESITGGYVYTGSELPGLRGTYVYGDFVSGRIWALWIDDNRIAHNVLLIDTDLQLASFGLTASHELRIVDLRGQIYQLKAEGSK